MNCHFRNNLRGGGTFKRAFTLAEVVAAMVVLSLITSSVLIVVKRCVKASIDQRTRLAAFQIARENMESLLAASSLPESFEQGCDEEHPNISYESIVEPFYEPVTGSMWIRAVCSASYFDSQDEQQKVEFTHWLTNLTKTQMLNFIKQKQQEKEELLAQGRLAEFVIEHVEDIPREILLQFYNEVTGESVDVGEVDDFEAITEVVVDYLETIDDDETFAILYEQIPQSGVISGDKSSSKSGLEGKQDDWQKEQDSPSPPDEQRNEIIPGYTEYELNNLSGEELARVIIEYLSSSK